MPKDKLPPANARAVMRFMSCYKYGRARHLARDSRPRSIKELCGPRGHVESGRQETTSDTREPGSVTEAAYGVQKGNWTGSGNERQRPMSNQSCPQTRRQ